MKKKRIPRSSVILALALALAAAACESGDNKSSTGEPKDGVRQ